MRSIARSWKSPLPTFDDLPRFWWHTWRQDKDEVTVWERSTKKFEVGIQLVVFHN
jgi:hypothetical protein